MKVIIEVTDLHTDITSEDRYIEIEFEIEHGFDNSTFVNMTLPNGDEFKFTGKDIVKLAKLL